LVDDVCDLPDIVDGRYELQPDVLVFMQEAPKIIFDGVAITDLTATDGYNVSVNKSTDGIMFFGAAGVGSGVFTTVPNRDYDPGPAYSGVGARSINGLDGSVWIKGAYPVDVSMGSDLIMEITHKTAGGNDEED
jgi:hypothetical protein